MPSRFLRTLFPKFLVAVVVVVGLMVAVFDIYITNFVAARESDYVEERISIDAALAKLDLTRAPGQALVSWAKLFGERSQTRVTLIRQDGQVLADSEYDAETMENHARRPEVSRALRGAPGTDIRKSATLGRNFYYYAVPMPEHPDVAVLRLAVPLERVETAAKQVRERLLGASAVILGAALVLAYFLSRGFSSRVLRLQEFAGRIADRKPATPLRIDSLDELGALGNSLNRMADHLGEFMTKLETESRSLDTILSGMQEGVLAIDGNMKLTFCNPAFAKAARLKYPVEGHPAISEFITDIPLTDILQQVIETREPRKEQLRLTAPDAGLFIVHAVPFGGESGGQAGALAIFHDITDLDRLERVRRDFVTNASHELRTPITAIQGYVETLLDGAMEDPNINGSFLETIRANAIRLKDITADLLILSELEAGSSHMNDDFSLRLAVENSVRTATPEANLRQVRLIQDPVEDVLIHGVRLRLEQALINLLTNAAKFNRKGGAVTIGAIVRPDGMVEIRVSDTGIGIPEADLPRIFERFYRVDKARSREVGGTGLGLSIVKHAAEIMNGRVQVESELDRGSTFTVTLPVAARVPAMV
jgi:two-component system phosphate regulon sensor histidine kinase PhoR